MIILLVIMCEKIKINKTLIFLNLDNNIFGDKGAKTIEKEWK